MREKLNRVMSLTNFSSYLSSATISFRFGAHGASLRKLSDARENVEKRNISSVCCHSLWPDHETIMPDGLNML